MRRHAFMIKGLGFLLWSLWSWEKKSKGFFQRYFSDTLISELLRFPPPFSFANFKRLAFAFWHVCQIPYICRLLFLLEDQLEQLRTQSPAAEPRRPIHHLTILDASFRGGRWWWWSGGRTDLTSCAKKSWGYRRRLLTVAAEESRRRQKS